MHPDVRKLLEQHSKLGLEYHRCSNMIFHVQPSQLNNLKKQKIKTHIPWSVCVLSFVQIYLHSQRIFTLEFS